MIKEQGYIFQQFIPAQVDTKLGWLKILYVKYIQSSFLKENQAYGPERSPKSQLWDS